MRESFSRDREPSIQERRRESTLSTRSYYLIGAFTVLHGALLLLRATECLPDVLQHWNLNRRLWIALALLWFVWPIALLLHPARSWRRFVVPVVVSLLFLVPCASFYYWEIELAVSSPPYPTRDKPIVQKTEDLGAGFRLVTLAEHIEGGLESIYHGEYLFYRDRKLASWSSAAVSPSRQFAVYLEQHSRHPTLFRASDQQTIELDPAAVSDLAKFDWDEAHGKVVLVYSSGQSKDFLLR
jgi:hypothetical protein